MELLIKFVSSWLFSVIRITVHVALLFLYTPMIKVTDPLIAALVVGMCAIVFYWMMEMLKLSVLEFESYFGDKKQ